MLLVLFSFVSPTTRPVWVLTSSWFCMMGSCAGDAFACSSYYQTFLLGGPPKPPKPGVDLMNVEAVVAQLQRSRACCCSARPWLGFIREKWIIDWRFCLTVLIFGAQLSKVQQSLTFSDSWIRYHKSQWCSYVPRPLSPGSWGVGMSARCVPHWAWTNIDITLL